MRIPAFLAIAAVAWLSAGCATPTKSEFRASETQIGVVVWRTGEVGGKSRLACERDGAGNLRVRVFGREPALTITRIDGQWSMSGPLARGRWNGADAAVPASLEGWLDLAEACDFSDRVAGDESEMRTGRYSVRYRKRDGRVASIELVTLATGQRFRVDF